MSSRRSSSWSLQKEVDDDDFDEEELLFEHDELLDDVDEVDELLDDDDDDDLDKIYFATEFRYFNDENITFVLEISGIRTEKFGIFFIEL